MPTPKQVLVIGGGPGGYVAAIRAAQMGAAVTLVEKGELGGTCLNVGCMPTKVLLHTVEVKEAIAEAKEIGLEVAEATVNLDQLRKRKERVVRQLTGGVGMLLKANGVKVVKGTASFIGPKKVKVQLVDGGEENLEGDRVIIATGSVPVQLPIPGADLPGIWDSDMALEVKEIPERLLIIGGGVIGTEFANIFHGLGSKVTIVEMLPRILPPVDGEIAAALTKEFQRRGMDIYTDSKVGRIEQQGEAYVATVAGPEGEFKVEADRVLIAVGRRPYTEGLGLENTRVQTDRGRILVDEYLETAEPGVFAIGDAIGGVLLAHVAFAEGERAAANALGEKEAMDYTVIPNCIFTQPEVAAVGLTEEEAREQGEEIVIGRFPFQANGKALIQQETRGMVKIIAGAEYGEILGVHIMGPNATELILEGGLAIHMEATLEEIYGTIHPHPTVGEAIAEAAMAAAKRALHIPNM
ncbi:MAG: dihydrolipoyl dehydrogenase [bacterium]|nr:dihydrolipoyl dehydrogenase [Bacillota bacterium]